MKFDVIIIGGGLAGATIAQNLQESGKKCCVVTYGRSINNVSYKAFEAAGGTLLLGHKACNGAFAEGRLKHIQTLKLGKTRLEAEWFVLASGKFFGGGLRSDMEGVYESTFGCDVYSLPDPESWFNVAFAERQPFLEFGVKTQDCRCLMHGERIENLLAAGEILEGVSIVDGTEKIMESAAKVVQIIKEA